MTTTGASGESNLDDSTNLQNIPQNQTTEKVLSDHVGDSPNTAMVNPNPHNRKTETMMLHLPFRRDIKKSRARDHGLRKHFWNVLKILFGVCKKGKPDSVPESTLPLENQGSLQITKVKLERLSLNYRFCKNIVLKYLCISTNLASNIYSQWEKEIEIKSKLHKTVTTVQV